MVLLLKVTSTVGHIVEGNSRNLCCNVLQGVPLYHAWYYSASLLGKRLSGIIPCFTSIYCTPRVDLVHTPSVLPTRANVWNTRARAHAFAVWYMADTFLLEMRNLNCLQQLKKRPPKKPLFQEKTVGSISQL